MLLTLILESTILFGNKFLFLFEPKRHFLQNFYFAKELASNLKAQGITSVKTRQTLQNRLRFYGISDSKTPILRQSKNGEIKIKYWGKNVASYKLEKE